MSLGSTLFIFALLVSQSLAEYERKTNDNLAIKAKRSDSSSGAGNTDSQTLQKALTREARSILPLVLFGMKHPLIMKAMVTIGKITIPLLAYYLHIVIIQAVMRRQENGDYVEEGLAKYKIPQSTKNERYLYTYNVTYEDGAYKLYNSTIFPMDNAYDMLFKKFEQLGRIFNIDIKYQLIPKANRTVLHSTASTGIITMTTSDALRNTIPIKQNPQIKENKPTDYNRGPYRNRNHQVQANQVSDISTDEGPVQLPHTSSNKYQETLHIQHTDGPYVTKNVQKQPNKHVVNEEYPRKGKLNDQVNHVSDPNKESLQNAHAHDVNKIVNGQRNSPITQTTPMMNDHKNANSDSNMTELPPKVYPKVYHSKMKELPTEVNRESTSPLTQTKRPTSQKKRPSKQNEEKKQIIQKTSDEAFSPMYDTGYDRYGFPISN